MREDEIVDFLFEAFNEGAPLTVTLKNGATLTGAYVTSVSNYDGLACEFSERKYHAMMRVRTSAFEIATIEREQTSGG